ncbi:RNA 2',3'-cyclic phosphodiesterase [Alkalicoccus urumqiensis]|uniref:RNA 2',3'-cyclic phosphodiesterase n=1 Tax=Alkalicoccus urumqiensis TaxID=1548213 RepID=A0A2P6MGH9_ALKUR|nr:RNA 2',3'-cyclic phosphodiesterase [Alkalicoccus urumqiensis]PRO65384.1 RNA 2',3'-cyclic phosphodiesterase [Alkalicoccus urumqiensis]
MEHHFIAVRTKGDAAVTAEKAQAEAELDTYFKTLVHPADFHITLLFLGGWDMEKTKQLWKALQNAEAAGGKVKMEGYGWFGSRERPGVCYLDVKEEGPLPALYQCITEEAAKLGFPLPKRPFKPHVTLAKKWAGGNQQLVLPEYVPASEQVVKEIDLLRVHPGKKPSYETLDILELKEAEGKEGNRWHNS